MSPMTLYNQDFVNNESNNSNNNYSQHSSCLDGISKIDIGELKLKKKITKTHSES